MTFFQAGIHYSHNRRSNSGEHLNLWVRVQYLRKHVPSSRLDIQSIWVEPHNVRHIKRLTNFWTNKDWEYTPLVPSEEIQ